MPNYEHKKIIEMDSRVGVARPELSRTASGIRTHHWNPLAGREAGVLPLQWKRRP